MKLLCIVICAALCSGCATTYEGLTNMRIRATEFKGQFGPFHSAEGTDVDISLTRKMGLTGDRTRDILENPDIEMTNSGPDSTFKVVK